MAKNSKNKSEPKIVIVRSRDAGVHVGELVAMTDGMVTLRKSHRIWRWRGANTLSELARDGASMTEWTRIAAEIADDHHIAAWCEIIPVSAQAAINLRTPRWL